LPDDGDDVADVEGDEDEDEGEDASRKLLLNLDDGELLELLEIPSLTEPRSDEVDAEASWYDWRVLALSFFSLISLFPLLSRLIPTRSVR
jgi:hypothetical protein